MGTPIYHAEMSSKRFGGKPEDYIEIHELMDSSKNSHADLRHRALTHNSWFVATILEKVFGKVIENSDGDKVSVRDIGQWHIMEDFRGNFPSASDYLSAIRYSDWMNNEEKERPPSCSGLPEPDLDKIYLREKIESGEEKVLEADEIPSLTPLHKRGCGGAPGTLD